jgi:hypothetical protein
MERWSKITREEAQFQRQSDDAREQRIVKVVRANMDNPDFDWDTLCERFAGSTEKSLYYVLRKHKIHWDVRTKRFAVERS